MISPVYLAYDTKAVLGEGAVLCESRSLLADRFGPALEPESRRESRDRLITVPAFLHQQQAWRQMIQTGFGVPPEEILFGKLESRLVVNTTGDLEANPSLCLDRLTGIPFIPGSAVKACARRMAIQELRDCPSLETKQALLYDAALAFGWTAADWLTKADFIPRPDYEARWALGRSDFAWSCEPIWSDVCHEVQQQLWNEAFPRVEFTLANWRRLYAHNPGRVHFLPAYPWEPLLNDLELDVAAPHHKRHFRRAQPREPASDTEEPVPAFFPAVAPGHVFVFVLLAKRRAEPAAQAAISREPSSAGQPGEASAPADRARRWLQQGLAWLGLGARTNAGYGWFDTSDAVQQTWQGRLRQEQTALCQEQEDRERERRQESELQAAAAQEETLRNLSDSDRLDYQLSQLTEVQFWGKLQHFAKHLDKHEKAAMVRVLQSDRLKFWEELKQRARKGGQWAQVEQAIRAAARQFKLDRMP